jgi:hypothetical protein
MNNTRRNRRFIFHTYLGLRTVRNVKIAFDVHTGGPSKHSDGQAKKCTIFAAKTPESGVENYGQINVSTRELTTHYSRSRVYESCGDVNDRGVRKNR